MLERPHKCALPDDLEDGPPRPRRVQPSNAGMIGLILSLVSLGLLLIIGGLTYALSEENRDRDNPNRTELMVYWFMLLNLVSFFSAIAATVFASFGLSPTNAHHRGWSVLALVLGIVEIVVTILVGLVLCCAGLLVLAHGAR